MASATETLKDTAMRFYKAYGLIIESEIEVDELVGVEVYRPETVDVTIRLGALSKDRLDNLMWLDPRIGIDRGTLWLHIQGLAKYAVIDGNMILVEPYPKADRGDLAVYLLGSSLGALLWQRGFLVLHGNSIICGDRAMVCVGTSGAGKSTLAGEFIRRGFPVTADDVVAIDSALQVSLGIPRIKLLEQAAAYLKVETCGLARVRANASKFSVPIKVDQTFDHCVARWIVELLPAECEAPEIEILGPMAALPLLVANGYRSELIAGLGLQSQHLLQCANLINHTIIARVKRPTKDYQLEQLADALLAFTEAHP